MEIQSFNSETHLSEIELNYIFPLCTRCVNIVMLFATSCYYCGSPEFWIPLPSGNFFDVRNERDGKKAELYRKQQIKSGIWFCGTSHFDEGGFTTFEEYGYDNYRSVYDESAKIRKEFFQLPENQRSVIYLKFFNKYKEHLIEKLTQELVDIETTKESFTKPQILKKAKENLEYTRNKILYEREHNILRKIYPC